MLSSSMEETMQRYLVPLIVGAALASACAGTYRATTVVSTPDLVYVSHGVYAVANYHDPIFYAHGSYWRYDSGYWYRSVRYTGGWVVDLRPPTVIVRIAHPYARYYRHGGSIRVDLRYRPGAHTRPMEIRAHRSRLGERSY
jgi:hypothetical protein